MTTPPDLVLDPEILTPLAERVLIRTCLMREFDLGDRKVLVPMQLVGERYSIADAPPELAGRIIVRLAQGWRHGFAEIGVSATHAATIAWMVCSPDTPPLAQVAELSIEALPLDAFLGGDDRASWGLN